MHPQAPQTKAAQHSPANQSVEQLGSREFQQQAIGLDLANLVSEYSGDLNGMLQGLVRIILDQSQCSGIWLASTKAATEPIAEQQLDFVTLIRPCLLYTSPSPRDGLLSRMPSSA